MTDTRVNSDLIRLWHPEIIILKNFRKIRQTNFIPFCMIPPVLFVAKKGFPFITKNNNNSTGNKTKKRESKVIQLT